MQAHDDDGDAGNFGEDVRIDADQAADGARAGAKRDKDGGEAEHEQRRADNRFAPDRRLRLRIGKALQRQPGEVD